MTRSVANWGLSVPSERAPSKLSENQKIVDQNSIVTSTLKMKGRPS